MISKDEIWWQYDIFVKTLSPLLDPFFTLRITSECASVILSKACRALTFLVKMALFFILYALYLEIPYFFSIFARSFWRIVGIG